MKATIKLINLIFSILLLFPFSAFAQVVAYDTTSTAVFTNTASGTWNHAITGTNPAIICSLAVDHNATGTTITSFTYNSNTLTPAGTAVGFTNFYFMQMSYGVAPATGSPLAAAFVMSDGTTTNTLGSCTSFTGAHQTTPVGTAQTIGGSAGTELATGVTVTVPTNGMSFDSGFENTGGSACDTIAVGSGAQTQRFNYQQCGSAAIQTVGSTRTTTGSFTWTGANSYNYQGLIGVPISPAAAAVTATRRRIVQ